MMTLLKARVMVRLNEVHAPPEIRKPFMDEKHDAFIRDCFWKMGHVLISYKGKHALWPSNSTLERLLSHGLKL